MTRISKFAVVSVALVMLALSTSRGGEAGTFYDAEATGYDVSFPQCGRSLPRDGSFGIVGVTNGLPWSANPCLATQYKWADSKSSAPSLYMNTANPLAQQVMAIRSLGRNKTEVGASYSVTSFEPTDYDQDIVWADGFFVRWPQKN